MRDMSDQCFEVSISNIHCAPMKGTPLSGRGSVFDSAVSNINGN